MKVKTSVALEEATLRAVDQMSAGVSRSRIIETAVTEYLERRRRGDRESRDRRILDEQSEALNREVEDILSFQVDL
jgi:metal-responsive CopG/Arc/MetJ family transcriptional regulator